MKKTKKITIICVAADLVPGKLGGAEHHCVEVVKRLSKQHQIILFVGQDTSIAQGFNANVVVVPIKYPPYPQSDGYRLYYLGIFSDQGVHRGQKRRSICIVGKAKFSAGTARSTFKEKV